MIETKRGIRNLLSEQGIHTVFTDREGKGMFKQYF